MTRTTLVGSHVRMVVPIVAATLIAACADGPVGGGGVPRELSASSQVAVYGGVTDTGFVPLPGGVGAVRGRLFGPPAALPGEDSVSFTPRIAGASVRVHAILGTAANGTVTIGPLEGETTTDANGGFQTPEVDGTSTDHALVITPPAGSGHGAVWVRVRVTPNSHLYERWITAPRQ